MNQQVKSSFIFQINQNKPFDSKLAFEVIGFTGRNVMAIKHEYASFLCNDITSSPDIIPDTNLANRNILRYQ